MNTEKPQEAHNDNEIVAAYYFNGRKSIGILSNENGQKILVPRTRLGKISSNCIKTDEYDRRLTIHEAIAEELHEVYDDYKITRIPQKPPIPFGWEDNPGEINITYTKKPEDIFYPGEGKATFHIHRSGYFSGFSDFFFDDKESQTDLSFILTAGIDDSDDYDDKYIISFSWKNYPFQTEFFHINYYLYSYGHRFLLELIAKDTDDRVASKMLVAHC